MGKKQKILLLLSHNSWQQNVWKALFQCQMLFYRFFQYRVNICHLSLCRIINLKWFQIKWVFLWKWGVWRALMIWDFDRDFFRNFLSFWAFEEFNFSKSFLKSSKKSLTPNPEKISYKRINNHKRHKHILISDLLNGKRVKKNNFSYKKKPSSFLVNKKRYNSIHVSFIRNWAIFIFWHFDYSEIDSNGIHRRKCIERVAFVTC